MEIRERLKYLRKSFKMNQTEFSEPLGVPQRTYSNYESGDRPIPDVFVKTLCQTYRINEEWFRTGEGEPELVEDRKEMLESLFRTKLPDEPEYFRETLVSALLDLDEDGWEKLLAAAEVIKNLFPQK